MLDFFRESDVEYQANGRSRQLRQERLTIDGNFHCTQSAKNSDPNDVSLYKGTGFFPTQEELTEHLASVARNPYAKEVI